MIRRVRALILFGLLVAASAGAIACFPDFAVGSAGDAGGNDSAVADSAAADGTTPTDGSSIDATDAGQDASHDADAGSTGADSSTEGGDSAVSDPVAQIAPGTFSFQVVQGDGGVVDAQAKLDYTLSVDRYEVTVSRFQAWVADAKPIPSVGQPLDAKYPTMTWQTAWNAPAQDSSYSNANCNQPGGAGPTYGKGSQEFPMNCTTWEQALAFCWWDGQRRLLTDTEWRVVATSEGRRAPYPWGAQDTSCAYMIYNDGSECGFPVPVGTATSGVTLDGVYDIVGSLSEWLWDSYGSTYVYPANAGTDYAGPSAVTPNNRLWLGGDYSDADDGNTFWTLQPGPQYASDPESNFDNTGWRCATSAP